MAFGPEENMEGNKGPKGFQNQVAEAQLSIKSSLKARSVDKDFTRGKKHRLIAPKVQREARDAEVDENPAKQFDWLEEDILILQELCHDDTCHTWNRVEAAFNARMLPARQRSGESLRSGYVWLRRKFDLFPDFQLDLPGDGSTLVSVQRMDNSYYTRHEVDSAWLIEKDRRRDELELREADPRQHTCPLVEDQGHGRKLRPLQKRSLNTPRRLLQKPHSSPQNSNVDNASTISQKRPAETHEGIIPA